MEKVPAEIITAVNSLLAPYGERYAPGQQPRTAGYKSAKDSWEYLGVSRSTFYRLVREGRLKPIRVGKQSVRGKTVFAISDLEQCAESFR